MAEGGPLGVGVRVVSTETWRRLAEVGRVETMVGVKGAGRCQRLCLCLDMVRSCM